jgi:hypothetical protein
LKDEGRFASATTRLGGDPFQGNSIWTLALPTGKDENPRTHRGGLGEEPLPTPAADRVLAEPRERHLVLGVATTAPDVIIGWHYHGSCSPHPSVVPAISVAEVVRWRGLIRLWRITPVPACRVHGAGRPSGLPNVLCGGPARIWRDPIRSSISPNRSIQVGVTLRMGSSLSRVGRPCR